MTAKAYLRQLKQLENAVFTMREELERLRSKAESPEGTKYTAARVMYSTGDALENLVVKLTMLENALLEKMAEYEEKRQRIVGEILSLPEESHSKVLYAIYVEGLPLWKTAKRMHYSRSHINRVHGKALANFYNRFLKGNSEFSETAVRV